MEASFSGCSKYRWPLDASREHPFRDSMPSVRVVWAASAHAFLIAFGLGSDGCLFISDCVDVCSGPVILLMCFLNLLMRFLLMCVLAGPVSKRCSEERRWRDRLPRDGTEVGDRRCARAAAHWLRPSLLAEFEAHGRAAENAGDEVNYRH